MAKPKVVKRKYNIYCDDQGNFWWDDGINFWGMKANLKNADQWFSEEFKLMLREAKGLE